MAGRPRQLQHSSVANRYRGALPAPDRFRLGVGRSVLLPAALALAAFLSRGGVAAAASPPVQVSVPGAKVEVKAESKPSASVSVQAPAAVRPAPTEPPRPVASAVPRVPDPPPAAK